MGCEILLCWCLFLKENVAEEIWQDVNAYQILGGDYMAVGFKIFNLLILNTDLQSDWWE